MAQIRIDELETNETLTQTDVTNIYQSGSGGLRRDKQIPINEMNVGVGMKLSPDRIAFQELTSGALSNSGWYTIAETGTVNFESSLTSFKVLVDGNAIISSVDFIVAFTASNTTRTYSNNTIKIISQSTSGSELGFGINGVRIAKSDSAINSGYKVQVKFDTNTTFNIYTQIKNMSNSTNAGLFLITPTQTDTNLLPDGVTAATFLEAGAEFDFGTQGMQPTLCGVKGSDDFIVMTMQWPENIKQGTGLSISNLTSIRLSQGATVINLNGAETISNYTAKNNNLSFRINRVGAFSTFVLNQRLDFRTIADNITANITG